MKKLNLAIIGQGRSGKDIHGKYLISQDNTYYNVKYVVDADEYRRKVSAERYEGCKVFSDYRELLDKKDIDLVVNASYSDMHFEITKDLLEHKFNVLVEKPFARNQYECDVLIQLAKQNNVILATNLFCAVLSGRTAYFAKRFVGQRISGKYPIQLVFETLGLANAAETYGRQRLQYGTAPVRYCIGDFGF